MFKLTSQKQLNLNFNDSATMIRIEERVQKGFAKFHLKYRYFKNKLKYQRLRNSDGHLLPIHLLGLKQCFLMNFGL